MKTNPPINDHPKPETQTAPQPEPQKDPLPPNVGLKDLFEALLRRPAQLAGHDVCDEKSTMLRFGIIALISIVIFGFVLGTFAYGHQLWAAPLKLTGGMLFAAVICFPSLYIFSSLAGANTSVVRMGGLLGGMLALAGLLLLGFAPAVWIFAQGTASFGFIGFLALSAWMIALIFAFRFLRIALRQNGANQTAPIAIWFIIFLLVTLQLSTSLRPILGTSEKLFNPEKKFFLQHWGEQIGEELIPKTETDLPSPTSR